MIIFSIHLIFILVHWTSFVSKVYYPINILFIVICSLSFLFVVCTNLILPIHYTHTQTSTHTNAYTHTHTLVFMLTIFLPDYNLSPRVILLQVFLVVKGRICFFKPFMKVCNLSRRRNSSCHLCML